MPQKCKGAGIPEIPNVIWDLLGEWKSEILVKNMAFANAMTQDVTPCQKKPRHDRIL